MENVFAPNLLAGKAALVTGGGSGIGAGIAMLFAHHGAKVALVGRTLEKLENVAKTIRDAGGEASTHACDVRDYPALEKAINDAATQAGRLDLLVNSAAGNFLAPAASLSANGFRSVVDIDLCGTFNACRAAFAHLAKQGGSIVSITATQADVPTPLQVHAGAAKAGIAKLTRDLALEWGRMGIRVNAVAPGPVEGTEGMSRLAPPDVESGLKKRVPLGRYGTIDEIAAAVLYLVSPAGAYVTGSTLLIDGGTSLIGPGPFLDMMGG
ncbi:SDR family oxidoreductase [Labilithrix luteola]|uniref:SDR family oxidoreductase n=1 Tax=Labilithrix luteola TaxID=1391654 RepID=UPI0011BA81B1|nr:SDR family oxidoreductase [Labilithrix luteola]